MTKMTVGEFEADPARAIAMAEAGVTVEVVRDGQAIVELRPTCSVSDVERRLAALDRIEALIGPGTAFGKKFSYEERTT
ncbi:hypothetical protein [Sphingomonas lenta]|nr:hypothetical protein [Sphingomonas lenta]